MGQPKYQSDGDPSTSGPEFQIANAPRRARNPAPLASGPAHLCELDVRLVSPRCDRRLHPSGAGNRSEDTAAYLPGPYEEVEATYSSCRHTRVALKCLDGGQCRERPVCLPCSSPSDSTCRSRFLSCEPLIGPLGSLDLEGIDWVIVGGESGNGARPLDLGWVRQIREKCAEADVALFVKQLGTAWSLDNGHGRSHGGDIELWPADLRLRRLPDDHVEGAIA